MKNTNKKRNTVIGIFVVVLLFVFISALSWGIVCGLIKLITMCFGLEFELKIATGIWLVFFLIKLVFNKNNKDK